MRIHGRFTRPSAPRLSGCIPDIQIVVDVLRNQFLLVCHFQKGTECGEVTGCGVLRQSFSLMLQLFCRKQVFTKLCAELDCEISEGAFALAEHLEVLKHDAPSLILLLRDSFEVFQKIGFELAVVYETELTVYDKFLTAATYKFSLFKYRAVEIALDLICGIGIEVYAEALMPLHAVGFWVADWRVIVEIQRDLTRLEKTLPKGYFCADIHNDVFY